MSAQPYPGGHAVGGTTPNPWATLIDTTACLWDAAWARGAAGPAHAALTAFAWYANRAITTQIQTTHALATMARNHAQAVAAASETGLPDGPLRAAMTRAAKLQAALADGAAESASRYGREFGHLAFAFPRRAR